MNYAQTLARAAGAHPDRVAMNADDGTVTYGELYERALRVAGALSKRGVGPGDVAAVMLPNGVDMASAYYGVLASGAAVATVNPLLRPGEVERLLSSVGATLLIHPPATDGSPAPGVAGLPAAVAASGPGLPEPVARDGGDVALLLCSSGTTGAPKAAEMTHANLAWSSDTLLDVLGDLGQPAAVLCAAPLFQGFGLGCGMNAMLRAGATIFTYERWDAPRALDTLERERVVLLQAVPAMCHDLLEQPDVLERDTSALRLCLTGAAPTPPDLLLSFERALGCELLEGYGLTEALRAAMNRPGRRKPGSIGLPLPGVDFRVEDGELWIRGPNVMRGYWRNDEATARVLRDGWLCTRDVVYTDDDGFLFVLGRVDDLISRGGYKVSPSEVESVLREHPAVADAAVVAIPDERLGSEVGAAVVPADGMELDVEEIREFMRSRVAAWKYPRRIWTAASLPRGFTGKLLRRQIAPPPAEPADRPA